MVVPILLNNKPSLSSSHSDLPGDKGAVGKLLGPRGPSSPWWPVASRQKGDVLDTLQDLRFSGFPPLGCQAQSHCPAVLKRAVLWRETQKRVREPEWLACLYDGVKDRNQGSEVSSRDGD